MKLATCLKRTNTLAISKSGELIMSNPIPILDDIQLILSPLAFESADASVVYPRITAKLQELRDLKVEEAFLDLIDDSA
jgi:hypothetical protein